MVVKAGGLRDRYVITANWKNAHRVKSSLCHQKSGHVQEGEKDERAWEFDPSKSLHFSITHGHLSFRPSSPHPTERNSRPPSLAHPHLQSQRASL